MAWTLYSAFRQLTCEHQTHVHEAGYSLNVHIRLGDHVVSLALLLSPSSRTQDCRNPPATSLGVTMAEDCLGFQDISHNFLGLCVGIKRDNYGALGDRKWMVRKKLLPKNISGTLPPLGWRFFRFF